MTTMNSPFECIVLCYRRCDPKSSCMHDFIQIHEMYRQKYSKRINTYMCNTLRQNRFIRHQETSSITFDAIYLNQNRVLSAFKPK